MLPSQAQNQVARPRISGGSEGCVYVDSPPVARAGGMDQLCPNVTAREAFLIDSPAWRHITMLGSLVPTTGNTPNIAGFFDTCIAH